MPTPEEIIAELNKTIEEQKKAIEAAKSSSQDLNSLQTKVMELEKTNQTLLEEDKKTKIQLAKSEAVKKYPLAAGLTDRLRGEKAEEIEADAKTIHDLIASGQSSAAKVKEEEMVRQWGGLPKGGTPPILNQEDFDSKMKEAKERGDVSAILRLKMGKVVKAFGF